MNKISRELLEDFKQNINDTTNTLFDYIYLLEDKLDTLEKECLFLETKNDKLEQKINKIFYEMNNLKEIVEKQPSDNEENDNFWKEKLGGIVNMLVEDTIWEIE